MIWVYRILFLPLLLLSAPYYLYRMFRRGGYQTGFFHRFGLIGRISKAEPGTKRIWLQAVSVGEVLAVGPVLKSIAINRGEKVEVVLTTTTSTGLAIALERYRDVTAAISVFPLDFWLFSRLAWNCIQPDLAILMESELWPEHIHQAKRRKTPVILINGRLSDRSYRRYGKFASISRWLTRSLDSILVASDQDRRRFTKLGAPPENIQVTGNLKFDVSVEPKLSPAQIAELKEELGFLPTKDGETEPVILLGSSTWPGEEVSLIKIFEEAIESGINCRLLLVPRHAERRNEIERILKAGQHSYHLRSMAKQSSSPVMIYVADTTGELKMLTQAADLIFIGKSLPPNIGGQTPIEAAALGKPLIFGPAMNNFRPVCQSLLKRGAALRIEDEVELKETILQLLKDPDGRSHMALAAQEWHASNQGAAREIQREIEYRLKELA